MQPLGRNDGGYRGETIDITGVLREIDAAARQHGWHAEALPAAGEVSIPTLTRASTSNRQSPIANRPSPLRLYLSAGIHGDEPAGPLAMLQLIRENQWPAGVDLWLCPCLNPSGFPLNRRENAQGIDLNRQYLHVESAETRVHIDWLLRQPQFDAALCLHEDWESGGFYLYELNPDSRPSHAEGVIRRVAEVCPIDLAELIEARPARGGIIRPSPDPKSRPHWPEAFWLLAHKTRHSYTLEAPSDFLLSTRVAALVTAVRTIVEGM